MFKFYEVGGCVRDEIMGVKSKDIDYVAVLQDTKFKNVGFVFDNLEMYLKNQGYTVWLSTPDCFTIRAKFPEGHRNAGVTADFVLARKEVGYIPGTRRPIVEVGTLLDDLSRRDFTVNAISKDEDGNIYDPFHGMIDIRRKVLATPLDVNVTLNDDPLRIIRAMRFCITKGFTMCTVLQQAIDSYKYFDRMPVVSEERIREELHKCFKHNTWQTLEFLREHRALGWYIFHNTKLWLKPTNEQ